MKPKFLLILTFSIFPYGSKCLSRSLVLVWTVSKLMTNKVFEGLVLAEDLLELSALLTSRSCLVHSTRIRRPFLPNSILSSLRIASSASLSSSIYMKANPDLISTLSTLPYLLKSLSTSDCRTSKSRLPTNIGLIFFG